MKLGKVLILGDSYSTFEGHIPPGYDSWYYAQETDATDVRRVEQTWWYPIFDGKDNVLLLNDSFSGTTICNDVREEHRVEWSFINRFERLVGEGFFEKDRPDTVFVFGGTNDSWIDRTVGECRFDDFSEEDLMKILPACGYLGKRLKEEFPGAAVCWLINDGLKPEIKDGIIRTADHFGQKHLLFKAIHKMSGHPSVMGMQQIRAEIEALFG